MEKQKSIVRKFVSRGIFFLLIALIAVWTVNRFLRLTTLSLFARASTEKKFMTAWEDDINRLDRAKILPEGFRNLKKIKLFTHADKIKEAFKKYPLATLTEKNDGSFDLEIFADDIEGGGVVIQYDLVELKSGNTIWELGRTFPQNINR